MPVAAAEANMPNQPDPGKRQCSLLLFLAVPAEEDALLEVARDRGLAVDTIKAPELGPGICCP
jgi:hypothetical protein